MASIVVSTYKHANDTLRLNDLRQALYDEGAILMEKVLVNLHGDEHRSRRAIEIKVFRRDFFEWYEKQVFPTTLRETLSPYLAAGRTDLVDFGFRVMMNLTADFSGVDRPDVRLTKRPGCCASCAPSARLPRSARLWATAKPSAPRYARRWTSSTPTSSGPRWRAAVPCSSSTGAASSPRRPCPATCWWSCCAARARRRSRTTF